MKEFLILQKKYNVISILLGSGPLEEHFLIASSAVVGPLPLLRGNPVLAASIIEQLTKLYTFKFAIINSIESRVVLPALARWCVPAISLIHEFAAYTRPREAFIDAVLWSQEIIFSTSVTCKNAISEHPELEDHSFHIIPQGRCTLPFVERDTASQTKEEARILRVLRPEGFPADTVVILGVGSVQIRKGVDLFIESAARVMQSLPGGHFRFVWFGGGYDPEHDTAYSVYLADQIRRAGLQEYVFIMEDTPNIETAYRAADLFILSSRLDPLPNVAIDAMAHGLPCVCFERTTGIADILTANGLGEECVAPYMDTAQMAVKVKAFIQSKPLRQKVGEQLRQLAHKEFDMGNYVTQIEELPWLRVCIVPWKRKRLIY
ncbi:MAG: glycosyltransferase family 4 protein [Candidatus Xenobiia bacterium LiM19]